MRGLLIAATLAVCPIFAVPSFAADYPKTEVFGSAGWGKWWDDEGASVSGFNAGGGIGRRLLPQFAIEAEVNAFRATRSWPVPVSPYRVRGFHLVGNGVLYVARLERTHVFILLGAGAAHSTVKMDFGSYHHSGSNTGYVANAGAGVKIFLTDHVALRPEVRLIAGSAGSSVSKPFSAELKFSMGLGYHW